MNGLPSLSRPGAISTTVAGYSTTQGIGMVFSNYGETTVHSYARSSGWNSSNQAGLLSLYLSATPSNAYVTFGFRVTR